MTTKLSNLIAQNVTGKFEFKRGSNGLTVSVLPLTHSNWGEYLYRITIKLDGFQFLRMTVGYPEKMLTEEVLLDNLIEINQEIADAVMMSDVDVEPYVCSMNATITLHKGTVVGASGVATYSSNRDRAAFHRGQTNPMEMLENPVLLDPEVLRLSVLIQKENRLAADRRNQAFLDQVHG
jgi:hypothetical protein